MPNFPEPTWNDTAANFPDSLCIHELFERQVTTSPHSVALIDGELQYTYEALNDQANTLAITLRNMGMRSEQVVGCYLSRSSAIVICTLAILKSGGMYLLLDSAMPPGRLGYIIGDARPAIIMADMPLPEALKSEEIKSINIHDTLEATVTDNLVAYNGKLPSTNAAYLAYTSGSTGRPKGVIITHQATVNHACAFAKMFMLNSSDKIPLMAPASFDMAIEEMIPPLVSGCTLIVSSSQYTSMHVFTEEVNTNGYTILNIPAPLWQQWKDYLKLHRIRIPPSLRLVIVGSEEIYTRDLRDWQQLDGADQVQWVAAYGTTETTVTSTFYTTAKTDDLRDEQYVPIGKPIANTYVYILDDKQQTVPVGKAGELYIGGIGLARGYHNRPGITANKFLPDPFRSDAHARMYRTGDLARFRPDGNIEWLGRVDYQIKLRGLRIEPGEIESVLHNDGHVNDVVVVLQKARNTHSEACLVAFITAEDGFAVDEKELRGIAEHFLPPIMQPQRYVFLQSMPLYANGKTDRGALKYFADCGRGTVKAVKNGLLQADV
jgi:amino acid adenylation domain-containing protein